MPTSSPWSSKSAMSFTAVSLVRRLPLRRREQHKDISTEREANWAPALVRPHRPPRIAENWIGENWPLCTARPPHPSPYAGRVARRRSSALHRRPQSPSAPLRISDAADRGCAAKQLLEFRFRQLGRRNGARVTGASSDDAENDYEIAPMDRLNRRRSRDLGCQRRGLFGLPVQRRRQREVGRNVEIARLHGTPLFECRQSFGKLSRYGLRDAEAIVGRTGIDERRSFGQRGEALRDGALACERGTEAEQRLGIIRVLCERSAIRFDSGAELFAAQIRVAEPHIRRRRTSRQCDRFAIKRKGGFAAAVRFNVARKLNELLRFVRARFLTAVDEWGLGKSCTSGETCQEHDCRE